MPNPKYKKTKKNGGIIPAVLDERVRVTPIGCGDCRECRHKKRREWQIRLLEEIKDQSEHGHMITLTFSTESLKRLNEDYIIKKIDGEEGKKIKIKIPIAEIEGYDKDNAIATRAMELFRERWTKRYGKAVRRFTVTELGGGRWEHLHLHGIIWTNKPKETIQEVWGYGKVWSGNNGKLTYVNERTIGYIIKYITKKDENHKLYKPIILCSPGIGANWIESQKSVENRYNEKGTNEAYRTSNGYKVGIPIYYRNKIYSDEEREKLWIEKLDSNIRYVNKRKYDVSKGDQAYKHALAQAQKKK